jgi:hypothetical protein
MLAKYICLDDKAIKPGLCGVRSELWVSILGRMRIDGNRWRSGGIGEWIKI